jgi:hypothetical protein
LAALAPSAFAQITADNIQRSEWNTRYESLGGGRVQATLTFDGDGGSYDTADGRGRLSDVTYDVRLGGGATIKGRWAYGGAAGSFTFFVAGNSDPPQFSGAWQSNGRSGTWNGSFVRIVLGGNQPGGQVTYGPWKVHPQKGYHYRVCTFPAGGYQYIIYYKETKPHWIYWYNPEKSLFWCACPTATHPQWGEAIQNGSDLFLIAITKAGSVEDCEFPDPGDDGANFVKGKAKDQDGSEVDLGCPPPDLP